MAEAITSLTLEINTQSVDEASKKLDAFSKKAEEAAVATDELTAAKKRSKKMTDEEIRDFERVYQNVMKAVKASEQEAEQERRLAAARKKLAESGDRLYTSYRNQIDGLRNINTASKELQQITEQVRASYKGGTLDINNYRQLLGDIAERQKEVTVAETIATKAKAEFINKLKSQVANQKLTKQQLLSYQAAQLGVSSSADIYIKKISQAATANKNYETSTRLATYQAAVLQSQLMRGNIYGLRNSGMSLIMKKGIAHAFGAVQTSINPLNIAIAAMVGLLGSMIPKLFETEDATEKLAAAQERLNKVMSTDKQSGMAFLSDDMMSLLSKNQALVRAALKSSENDLKTVISSAKQDLQDGLKGIEHGWTEWLTGFGTNNQSGLNNVLDQIAQIKSRGLDLNSMLSSSDLAMYNFVSGIKGKIENYADYFNITHEQAQAILEQMADIKSEVDSIKASEKINKLINELSDLYNTTNNSSERLDSFISSLVKIAEKSEDAALKVNLLKAQQENLEKAIDPKKSPFYQYSQMAMTREERIETEIKEMNRLADAANKIFKPTDEGYVTDDKRKAAAEAIRERHKEKGGSKTSATDLLQSSKQQEISLTNQLKSLREQSLTVNTITSERKKYYDLQAQIEVLESKTDKSKLTAQEKYILGHKEALLAQHAKNAAISEEIAQYETATKALRKMKEYTSNVITTAGIKQATFGMTQKQAGREEELIRLNKNQNDDLAKITDPVQVSEVTKKYTEAKEALQQSWQQEDQNQGDWITGMKVGLCEFAEDGQNVFKGFRDVAGNAMNSISHSLTELVTTGKMDFKSLTKSILTNIIEIINKLLVAQAIQSAMGWMGIGSSGGAGAATGGLQQAYTGGLIRGYASGGGVGYNDEPGGFTGTGNKYQPAGIVHKGEFVFTKEATKRLGVANLYALMREAQHGYANGGGVKMSPASPVAFTGKPSNSSSAINVTTNVAINMQSNSSSPAQIGNIDKRALEGQIKPIIQKNVSEVLKKTTSPGGELYILLNR